MNEELYTPSLQETSASGMETYNLGKMFYVAFFGGTIPTIILFTKIMDGLKLGEKKKQYVTIAGVGILALKAITVGLYGAGLIGIDQRSLRWIFRIAVILFYYACKKIVDENYRIFLLGGGQFKPILKDAVIYSLLGMVIELFLNTVFLKVVMAYVP